MMKNKLFMWIIYSYVDKILIFIVIKLKYNYKNKMVINSDFRK